MYSKLSMSPMFRGLKPDEIQGLIERVGHSVKSFGKGQTIAQREEIGRASCRERV